jgi:hypothetical protein
MAMDGGDYYPDPKVGDRPKDVDRTASLPLPKQTWAVSVSPPSYVAPLTCWNRPLRLFDNRLIHLTTQYSVLIKASLSLSGHSRGN